jgi:hypothetical protein
VAGITVLYKQWLNLPLVMDIFGNKWAADEEWEKHRCEKWQQQLLRIWIYGLEHWLMSLFQRSKIRVAIRLIAAGGKTQVAKRRWQNAGGKTWSSQPVAHRQGGGKSATAVGTLQQTNIMPKMARQ